MIENILFFVHSGALLIFGAFLSAAFCGIKFSKKDIAVFSGFCILSGMLQVLLYLFFSEDFVWKTYPLISHVPLLFLLSFGYHKRFLTAVVSVSTAYLCCQPAKWLGIVSKTLFDNPSAEYFIKIFTLISVFIILLFRFSADISEIFGKDSKSVFIFGITPLVYYIFDYIAVFYSDFWTLNNNEATEFLAFFLCVIFIVFCLTYHKEYEQKSDAQRKEQIIRITLDEQKKELDAVKRSEQAIRIMRHDMRHFLGNLSACIDNDDKMTAKKMISSYVENIDSTIIKTYCANTTLNYIFSSFAEKCREEKIDFSCKIEASDIKCDETMLSTVISNGIDNAINAQKLLPPEQRKIKVVLKNRNEKLLLSIKNPFRSEPVFKNGIPVSNKKGHGFGTQSIAYLTERMGGNWMFAVEDGEFVIKVII
ncbi:MAG: sensor histidine kinase [Oscillospiraceae bacterium]|nr:sensor histidine kinase [Oscillospiraceae bacterium]